eukprot:scaffold279618_cov28-Tisochrysis_lutea.AAC.1
MADDFLGRPLLGCRLGDRMRTQPWVCRTSTSFTDDLQTRHAESAARASPSERTSYKVFVILIQVPFTSYHGEWLGSLMTTNGSRLRGSPLMPCNKQARMNYRKAIHK